MTLLTATYYGISTEGHGVRCQRHFEAGLFTLRAVQMQKKHAFADNCISKKAGSIQGPIGADGLILQCSHSLAGPDRAMHGLAYT